MFVFASRSLRLIGAIVITLAFAIAPAYVVNADHHDMPMNEAELFARVADYDVGWDYVPYCNDDAYWDIHNNRCEGGTGNDGNSPSSDQDGYGITGPAHLSQMVKRVNAGWNWVPRCDEDSYWSMDDKRCKGGSD